MTTELPLPPLAMPTEPDFLREALIALPVCIEHCQCPDHWHLLWAGLKASGLLRGVHAQAPMLRQLLQRRWVAGGRILIAGAADAGSLEVLHALYADTGARYTVVDRCPAPLKLVEQRALTLPVAVDTRLSDLDALPAGETWDLVFIHYTLSFMDAATRAAVFRALKARLAPGGVIVCAIRYLEQPAAAVDASAQARWQAATEASLKSLFSDHPALLDPLLHGLPAYAASRQQREQHMPHVTVVRDEITAAGLAVEEEHAVTVQAPSARPDLSRAGTVQSRYLLAVHADAG